MTSNLRRTDNKKPIHPTISARADPTIPQSQTRGGAWTDGRSEQDRGSQYQTEGRSPEVEREEESLEAPGGESRWWHVCSVDGTGRRQGK
jgi:hypothetical protein